MGTLAHAFESGEQSSQKGHFRNLVLLARLDGEVSHSERLLLEKIANRLSITPEQVKVISDNPSDYPMIPPVSREERYERLISFVQMALSDGMINEIEENVLHKLAIQLGFTEERVNEKLPVIEQLAKEGKDRSEILAHVM